MAIVRPFAGIHPTIGSDCYLADSAVVVGDVKVGARSSVWYGAVLRGDMFPIRIGEEVSIQDNTVVHVTGGEHATTVGNRVTVGHRAILHGCTIEERCIIGMGAIVLDGVRVCSRCIVGAGALLTPGTEIGTGQLVLGAPARPIRALTPEELAWIESSADHYVALAAAYLGQG